MIQRAKGEWDDNEDDSIDDEIEFISFYLSSTLLLSTYSPKLVYCVVANILVSFLGENMAIKLIVMPFLDNLCIFCNLELGGSILGWVEILVDFFMLNRAVLFVFEPPCNIIPSKFSSKEFFIRSLLNYCFYISSGFQLWNLLKVIHYLLHFITSTLFIIGLKTVMSLNYFK